jgi:hypothetical protein
MAFIVGSIIGAGASLLGGYMASQGAQSAADAQARSAKKAQELQREMWLKNLELNAPFRAAGLKAQNSLLDYLGLSGRTGAEGYGEGAQSFTMDKFKADPGYAFRMSEGLKALDANAAARGGLISGNALRAAEDYGQNAASGEYQNAFNRYYAERNAKLNPLQSLLGVGQSASQALGSAGQNYATNAGGDIMAGGAARASGYLGGANAWNQALGGVGNALSRGMVNSYMYGQNNPYSYGAGGYYGQGPYMGG